MKTLTINVPDDQDAEVSAWEDGKSYNLTVTQTGPLTFDLVSTAPEEAEPTEGGTETMPAKMPPTVAALANE